jgi:hypothetical protein
METMTEQEQAMQHEAAREHDRAASEEAGDFIRAQVETADPGPLAQDEETRLLYRYLRIRAQAVAELTTLKDQMAAMVRSAESRVKSLDYVYSEFAARITAAKIAGGKSKSLKTPFGTVGFRAQRAALVVVDAAMVPVAFKTLKQDVVVNKVALNEHWQTTGEVAPGCDVTDARETFYLPK